MVSWRICRSWTVGTRHQFQKGIWNKVGVSSQSLYIYIYGVTWGPYSGPFFFMGNWRYMKVEYNPMKGFTDQESSRKLDSVHQVLRHLTLEKLSGPQDITRPSPRRAAKAKAVASKKATSMKTEGRMWDIRRTKNLDPYCWWKKSCTTWDV